MEIKEKLEGKREEFKYCDAGTKLMSRISKRPGWKAIWWTRNMLFQIGFTQEENPQPGPYRREISIRQIKPDTDLIITSTFGIQLTRKCKPRAV
ncbi:hypothetical protein EBAPG3_009950 [Nitrosospira lacus]|uniref:Uncharacterized protein n=1 Tax=Nitrosospira lacus TaxID=1288494 RepID=A0A1W6SQI3_9PROT|nr:hypothetical protein EBAPG3_009950 [Nitrosospira lacus]